MKIFVTGGAGFIGRHFTDFMLKNGHQITIFDDFSNSNNSDIGNTQKKGVSLIEGDITNYSLVSDSIKGHDAVIHLAAQIDVQDSIKDPKKTHDVNVTGTVNLLRACVKNNVKNIVAASSAAIFGNPPELPLSENSKTIPISPYGASKLAMEHYLQAFAHSFDLNCVSLRFFNVYGKGQSSAYAGVITKFMEKIAKNQPLIIFGDGSATRDFVSVDDVIQAISNALSNIANKRGSYYNIGSGSFTTIQNIAKMMIEISAKQLPIEYENPKPGDILHSQTSITLAQKEIGYNPKIKLRQGLEKLLSN